MEPDKRLRADGSAAPPTVSISLPYIKAGTPVPVVIDGAEINAPNPFQMPNRVFTLASMNSVDKSVAPLDTALRRRFHMVNLMPDLGAMATTMNLPAISAVETTALPTPLASIEEVQKLGLRLVASLNLGISIYLGSEYAFGEWYLKELLGPFATIAEATAALSNVWEYGLLPQLEELFSGRMEQLEAVLKLIDGAQPSDPVYLERPDETSLERGGLPFLRTRTTTQEGTIAFLRRVANVPTPPA
jgi:hypothetical protein